MDSRPVLLKTSGATAGSCSSRDQHGKGSATPLFLTGASLFSFLPIEILFRADKTTLKAWGGETGQGHPELPQGCRKSQADALASHL